MALASLSSPSLFLPRISLTHSLETKKSFQSFPHIRLLPRTSRSHLLLRSQNQPNNNLSEDTDEMFDDLFEKYGKVVFRRNDQKPPSAEAEDDAESLSFAVALAKVASDVKAGDIRVLFVKPLVYWTRFFIIATAFSRPQIDAIGSRIRDLAEKQFKRVATGDYKPNSWTLLDFGDVVVHIFLPQQREHYNLEEFYANATPIELPFDTQSSFRN
ncbi:Protein Iojap/ribosomal silencing factor RsfS [Cinnamomum micranthum f. kanehirae]|uniref:Protein Iojap, chloroplastic n=1 Tax=Cinnamomum micranthum f. kanehirae TaxID=337451 RepID=A0A3S4PVG0_9MAGN|nr:Protein Iojap/ribosomal silencing factor RsfS [Cinnamomum micranthum f. kanehirae]